MKIVRNILLGMIGVVVLVIAGSLIISQRGNAQVQPPPVVSATAVYGPPASSIVEIKCTNNSGLLYPGNSCTSVLPDGRRGDVYLVPARSSLVITSVHIESLDFKTDNPGAHVHEFISLGSPGPNGVVNRADWIPVGGTNVWEYPAGIVLPPGYAPNGYGLATGEYLVLRGYLSPN